MSSPNKPLCFVIMPFGTKLDAGGSPVQFDRVYAEIISPAISQAGMQPIRADGTYKAMMPMRLGDLCS